MNAIDLQITTSAVKRIKQLLEQRSNSAFRISVEGGGCAEFQYRFEITDNYTPSSDDIIIFINSLGTNDDGSVKYHKISHALWVKKQPNDEGNEHNGLLSKAESGGRSEPSDWSNILVIDEGSYQFLIGSIIEFQQDLGGSSFVIKNPNAKTKCGCGLSFST